MAKESAVRENPVLDSLRKLKEDEAELMFKLKPLQEAITALEKIVEKTVKKAKSVNGAKESSDENSSGADHSQDDSRLD